MRKGHPATQFEDLREMLRDGYTATEQITRIVSDTEQSEARWLYSKEGQYELQALGTPSQEAGDAIKKLLHRLEEGMDCEDCRAGFCSTPASLR